MNYGTIPEKRENGLHSFPAANDPYGSVAAQAFSSRIHVINEIAIGVNQTLDEEEILRTVGRKARWLLDFDHASAYLLYTQTEPAEDSVTPLFASGPSATFCNIFDRRDIQAALETRQPLLRPNSNDQRDTSVRSPYAHQLILPLQSEGQVLGTLHFASARHAYTHDDMRIGHLLALLLSGALGSARRFTQVSDLYRDLEEAYARLKQTEQRRDSLTSMIVHDLRHPLVTVLGTLELVECMSDELDVDAAVAEMVRRARRAGRRMAGQISDLIDVNTFEEEMLTPQCESLDLSQLLRSRAPEYEAQAGDEKKNFMLMLPQTLPVLCADAGLIGRVVDNLVQNAFKYTEPGGTLSICAAAGEERLTITVSDDGMGIPPEHREEIFDKYGQVPNEQGRIPRQGSGLGLAFCRMAVEAHGGRIWVQPNRPQGSIFAFTLPYR